MVGRLDLMYGDVGFFRQGTGRLNGSVRKAMVKSGLQRLCVEGIDSDERRMVGK